MEIQGNYDLYELLKEPREALDIEVKQWLDLSDNGHKAALAKEIIALANHGGGYIIVGFDELADGTFQQSQDAPSDLSPWSQDSVQAIVSRYVDPAIQCQVTLIGHPADGRKHPVIVVPGGHRVPVRAKKGSPDNTRLVTNRVYVRRPGPNSEEPRTTEDWDNCFSQIVRNRQDELLAAMRTIVSGELPTAPTSSVAESRDGNLRQFEDVADVRWKQLVADLPSDATPRLLNGYYDVGFTVDCDLEPLRLSKLADIVRNSVHSHSGWTPFLTISRPPFNPTAVDGILECWLGPDSDGSTDLPAHHDFWRVAPDGYLFTRRGYSEDGGYYNEAEGTTFDLTTPIWRLGEAILNAARILEAMGASDTDLLCTATWSGLAGRSLVSHANPRRYLSYARSAAQDVITTEQRVVLAAVDEVLPELVHKMLSPVYELFELFDLPKKVVEEELREMRRHTF